MTGPVPGRRPPLTRADLPAEFTTETVRDLPITTLRRLSDHRNGILSQDEQRAFDTAVHEVMRGTAERMSRADWSAIRRDAKAQAQRRGRPASRADKQLDRIARRIGEQVDLAETLAPGVDWSFAQHNPAADENPTPAPTADTDDDTDDTADTAGSPDTSADHTGTVSDLEQSITDQVELVEVMSEIAEISKRTYTLEQQRDLQSTRTLFFGLVVSVAVLVAGWAPLVAADDWTERWWTISLTLGTCVVAGLVYVLIRRRQKAELAAEESG